MHIVYTTNLLGHAAKGVLHPIPHPHPVDRPRSSKHDAHVAALG